METSLEISVAADAAAIATATDAIAAFCARHRVPGRIAWNLRLAVDELLTNVLSYGFRATPAAPDIRLRLSVEGEQLVTALSDNGLAFDPLAAAPPRLDLALEDKPIGGLGIYFVRQLMDGVEYSREGAYNRLTLRQSLREAD